MKTKPKQKLIHGTKQYVRVSTCYSCMTDIGWVYTEMKRPMPIDLNPQTILILNKETGRFKTVQGYRSHFATCPYADEHRKIK